MNNFLLEKYMFFTTLLICMTLMTHNISNLERGIKERIADEISMIVEVKGSSCFNVDELADIVDSAIREHLRIFFERRGKDESN